ncbi:MAG TPA: hypothetical protein VFZ06_06805, partial [Acidimicrobiia bacterium]|nr:hypothetical protein [Acidimicrobiia bacterium]
QGKEGHGGSVELRVDLETLAGLTEAPGELSGLGPVISDIARQVAREHSDTAIPPVGGRPRCGRSLPPIGFSSSQLGTGR